MPLERTPLAVEALPPGLQPFFAPEAPAGKALMLARGMAPGLGPGELATGLYQCSVHSHKQVAEAAVNAAIDLPDAVVAGALAEPLDPRVLDFFADQLRLRRPALLEPLLLNRATGDETIVDLTAHLSADRLLEIISKNEQRMLRCPTIIEKLYLNPNTRMSTANRCVELAVREGVVLNLPAYQEIADALAGETKYEDPMDQALADAEADAAFQSVATESEDEAAPANIDRKQHEEEDIAKRASLLGLSIIQKIRLSMVGTSYHRGLLMRDPNRVVAMAAVKSPKCKETEIIAIAASRSANDDVIRFIARTRDFVKLYQVKSALVQNPKCPLPVAMKLIPHLRLLDLKKLSKSKNVASAVRNGATQMVNRKT